MRSAKITLNCGRLNVPTAASIDRIARLQLAARRSGCQLELTEANPYLLELIGFVGLSGVLGVEAGRQAEKRKQLRCVKEECEVGDPPSG